MSVAAISASGSLSGVLQPDFADFGAKAQITRVKENDDIGVIPMNSSILRSYGAMHQNVWLC